MKDCALFLDRDGAINHDVGDCFHREQVRFVDGIFSLCLTAKKLGYRLVVISHQKGLARGVYIEADYLALMNWMREEFRREDVVFDGVYHCPCGSKHTDQATPLQEGCKPGAAMLCRAARELHLSLSDSVMVGTRSIDVAAANAGGLAHVLLLRETERLTCGGAYTAVDSLGEVEAWLAGQERWANRTAASRELAPA
jgi:D-glycero-D-manno-heptose 1,7-bisphosphate phosphatase